MKNFETNDDIMNLRTGEVINTELFKKQVNQNQKDEWINRKKYLDKKIQKEPENMTTEEIEELYKAHHKKNIAQDSAYDDFTNFSIHNKEIEEKITKKISSQAWLAFSHLKSGYSSIQNTLQFKNNRNITTNKQICKILDISRSTWNRVKADIEKFNLIRRIKFEGNVIWKVNPLIVGHSMRITATTYYAFRNEIKPTLPPIIGLYWDKKLIEEFGIDIFKKS